LFGGIPGKHTPISPNERGGENAVKKIVLILTAASLFVPALAYAQNWDAIINEIDENENQTGMDVNEQAQGMLDDAAKLNKEAEGVEYENKALEGKIMKVQKVHDWYKGIIAEDQKYIEGFCRGDTYTVIPGDCLWMIAGKVYGHPYYYKWPLIYNANRDQIKDPDWIYPDQVFTIPPLQ
jgi:nucleoid-associated protein YgaU